MRGLDARGGLRLRRGAEEEQVAGADGAQPGAVEHLGQRLLDRLGVGVVDRRQPLFVPGPWDFAGILFAASGFLLAGGPALLSSRSETWIDF